MGQPPVFVNKDLLEVCHTHSFMCRLWLLPCYNSRAKWLWQRPGGPQPKVFTISDPFRKPLPVHRRLTKSTACIYHWPKPWLSVTHSELDNILCIKLCLITAFIALFWHDFLFSPIFVLPRIFLGYMTVLKLSLLKSYILLNDFQNELY